MLHTMEKYYEVVISGMSIAAMACAYEALKNGKSVLMINNRGSEFTRGQRIVLHAPSREYLISMRAGGVETEEDRKFFKKLSGDVSVSIKNVERYLFRQLKTAYVDSGQLSVSLQSTITAVDLAAGKITYKQPDQTETTVDFRYLIGADGVKRNAYNQVKNGLADQQRAEIELISSIAVTHHIFAEAMLADSRENILPLKAEDLIVSSDQHFKGALYSKAARDFDGAPYTPVKLVCSAPDYIATMSNETDKKLAIYDYAATMIKLLLEKAGINPETVNIGILTTALNKQNIAVDKSPTLFQIQVQKCRQAFLTINGNHFVIAGDAFRTSEYDHGHGANDALSHAKKLGDHFAGKCTLSDYNKNCQTLADLVDMRGKIENRTEKLDTELNAFRGYLHRSRK